MKLLSLEMLSLEIVISRNEIVISGYFRASCRVVNSGQTYEYHVVSQGDH